MKKLITRWDEKGYPLGCFFPGNIGKVSKMDCNDEKVLKAVSRASAVMTGDMKAYIKEMKAGLKRRLDEKRASNDDLERGITGR